MQIKFNFKSFDPSEHLKKYAQDRFSKLSKYLNDSNVDLTANLEVEKFRHIADVVLKGKNMHISATEESEDMYSTIDLVLDKLQAQVRKAGEKIKDKKKKQKYISVRMDTISFAQTESGGKSQEIIESDRYEPKPMSVEEAAMQLENKKEEFLVFLNAETERINVIYARKNGNFGLIDPGI